jgi:hypothetical protein
MIVDLDVRRRKPLIDEIQTGAPANLGLGAGSHPTVLSDRAGEIRPKSLLSGSSSRPRRPMPG